MDRLPNMGLIEQINLKRKTAGAQREQQQRSEYEKIIQLQTAQIDKYEVLINKFIQQSSIQEDKIKKLQLSEQQNQQLQRRVQELQAQLNEARAAAPAPAPVIDQSDQFQRITELKASSIEQNNQILQYQQQNRRLELEVAKLQDQLLLSEKRQCKNCQSLKQQVAEQQDLIDGYRTQLELSSDQKQLVSSVQLKNKAQESIILQLKDENEKLNQQVKNNQAFIIENANLKAQLLSGNQGKQQIIDMLDAQNATIQQQRNIINQAAQ